MSNITLSTFTQFSFTEAEQLAATSLTTETKQFIQTEYSKIAEQRLALEADPNNYPAFIQQDAFLKGQMQFARWLLDCAAETEKILATPEEPKQ